MFEQSLVESAHRAETRKLATVLTSLSLQAAAVIAIAIIPLLHLHALPSAFEARWLDAPPPAVPAAPAPPATTQYRTVTSAIPSADVPLPPIAIDRRPPSQLMPVPPGVPVGDGPPPVAAPPGISGPALTPPPPPPPLPRDSGPVAVGGEVESARCLACAPPQYPQFARQAHLQGTVELRAVIGADGGIQELEVVKGNPILAGAALQAVRRWRYRPLILDGHALAVAISITVNFNLGNL
ncbi:MAG TPA: energy transducer TonB [Terriglobales bacterium]|nr:energy transducer TonB [Terriglobales bacterium]